MLYHIISYLINLSYIILPLLLYRYASIHETSLASIYHPMALQEILKIKNVNYMMRRMRPVVVIHPDSGEWCVLCCMLLVVVVVV